MPAELVTFYDTGELKRIFPLDGKVSGFWSEEDERGFNVPLNFEFDFASFSALISGLCFYKNGCIRSVTLFPNEIIRIGHEPNGTIDVRHGFSLHESGRLQSLEPASPVKLRTPIGTLTAFDPNAVGINADMNSLCFDEQGRIISLITAGDRIHTYREGSGASSTFMPKIVYVQDESAEVYSIKAAFDYDSGSVTITDADGAENKFAFSDTFVVYNNVMPSAGCTGGDCSNCSLCGN